MDALAIMRATARASAAIGESDTPGAVAARALSVVQDLGYSALSIVRKNGPDSAPALEVLYTCAKKEDLEAYEAKGFGAHNPIINRGLKAETPITAEEIRSYPLSGAERAVLDFLAGCGHFTELLLVPVRRTALPDGVIVFGGPQPNTSATARAALTILGHCAYARLNELRDQSLDPAARAAPEALSAREKEVMSWVAKGKCDSEIAIILGMSERTARFHVANAKRKLDSATRVQAVTRALELGLIAA